MGFRAANGGRRTDGIVVMEVPVYDPSGRKRKSHEWRREKRTKRYRREREGREEERESERETWGEGKEKARDRENGRESRPERERRRRKHGEGRMTKLNYKSYELAALQPSPPAVLPSPSATSASSSPPQALTPFYLRSISTHPTDAILGFSPFFASLLLR